MLDDSNVLSQRDPSGALDIAGSQYEQAQYNAVVQQPEHDGRTITRVVVAGMGGSALSALLAQAWLKSHLAVPFEVVRSYTLPAYVGHDTLVIASSCSGNTEETLSSFDQAQSQGAQIAVMASGGKLLEAAESQSVTHVVLPDRKLIEPRMTTIAQLRALVALLVHFDLLPAECYSEIAQHAQWLESTTSSWRSEVSTDRNYAKQLALLSVGKTPIFYGGELTAPLAYKWKISWNENAKNVAYCGQYPEMSHNEFIGWSSHPVEKPFAVYDLVSDFEHPRIAQRMELSARLLSGMRPKATTIHLEGDTPLAQLMWGCVLADFTSIYTAILNGVDPTPVELIERLKSELAKV